MRIQRLNILLLLACLASASWAETESTRYQNHLAASDKLLNLRFFFNGRGMHLVPEFYSYYDVIKKIPNNTPAGNLINQMIEKKWGLIRFQKIVHASAAQTTIHSTSHITSNETVDEREIVGLFREDYKSFRLAIIGCAICHAGKVMGKLVAGLGNKNIDVGSLGQWGFRFQQTIVRPHPERKRLQQQALRFAKNLSQPKLTNLTQGMVPTAVIRNWFYEQAHQPLPQFMPRGAVKVPALWGYGQKRSHGSFSDGFGFATLPGWAVAVELVGGQTPDNIRLIKTNIDRAEDFLAEILPPPYPLQTDSEKTLRGSRLFQNNCQKCHGSYHRDSQGQPIFEAPLHIPITVVKTDTDRLDGITKEFINLVIQNPLNDLIKIQPRYRPGYFAPRLEGIWARFPYLHNGSVPHLLGLLTAPEQRPKVFDLRDSGEISRFDSIRVGLSVPPIHSTRSQILTLLAGQKKRYIYDVRRIGHSNQGHSFGTSLSLNEKMDLVEYLKTL